MQKGFGKRLRRCRKGLAVDLDWIISLGIFLIYLGIFFLAIRQLPAQQSPTEALLENVFDGVTSSSEWHVQRLPLFITSNVSGTEPFIVDFQFNWKNFSFSDNTSFDLKDSKIIFTKNLIQGKNIIWLVSSGENYTPQNAFFDMASSPSSASVDSKRFTAEFQNALLLRAAHFDKERIDEFNISISGTTLKPETAITESNFSALSAKYKQIYPQLNHTSFLIGGYPRIISYASTDSREPHDLTLSATLRNYTSFYINGGVQGTINFTTKDCSNALGRYIDFQDGVSGVSFIVPEGSNISFCAADKTARLGIQFALQNETSYDIIFHEGGENSTLKYVSPYKAAFGIAENLTGISKQLYKKLNETSYITLKTRFSYPSSREFTFSLLNESGTPVFDYQAKTPGTTNVFAKEKDVLVLDKYGIKTRHKLRLRGW